MSSFAEIEMTGLVVTGHVQGMRILLGSSTQPSRWHVLERASARETTMRAAVGALAKCILNPFGITVMGHVASIGE
jgi:hypothetical protein